MSIASIKKVTWARLNSLSTKTQKYILNKEAGSMLTEMQTSYYRLKRQYLEETKGIDHHFGFGVSNRRWAHDAAAKMLRHGQTNDMRRKIAELTELADGFDAGEIGQRLKQAQANFTHTQDWIFSGAYKTEAPTDAALQAELLLIDTGILRIRYECRHEKQAKRGRRER